MLFDIVNSDVAMLEANDASGITRVDAVEELKDIIQVDYGSLNTPITLFVCEWKKNTDNLCRNIHYY